METQNRREARSFSPSRATYAEGKVVRASAQLPGRGQQCCWAELDWASSSLLVEAMLQGTASAPPALLQAEGYPPAQPAPALWVPRSVLAPAARRRATTGPPAQGRTAPEASAWWMCMHEFCTEWAQKAPQPVHPLLDLSDQQAPAAERGVGTQGQRLRERQQNPANPGRLQDACPRVQHASGPVPRVGHFYRGRLGQLPLTPGGNAQDKNQRLWNGPSGAPKTCCHLRPGRWWDSSRNLSALYPAAVLLRNVHNRDAKIHMSAGVSSVSSKRKGAWRGNQEFGLQNWREHWTTCSGGLRFIPRRYAAACLAGFHRHWEHWKRHARNEKPFKQTQGNYAFTIEKSRWQQSSKSNVLPSG